MRVTDLRLVNFLGFGDPGLNLDQIGSREILVGPNGSGKTSVLHAIEFVGKAFRREIQEGRPYVHRGDWTKSIDVRVGVRLEPDETRALGTALTYQSTVQQSQISQKSSIPPAQLNELVRRALSAAPRPLERVFDRTIRFCVSSTPGLNQTLREYIELPLENGSFYINQHGNLTLAPKEVNQYGGVNLLEEILKSVERVTPGLLTAPTSGHEAVREAIAIEVKKIDELWLFERLQPKDGIFMVLYNDMVPSFGDHPMIPSGSPDLIELRTLLLDRGYKRETLSLPQILGQIYNQSFIALGAMRSRPVRIAIQDLEDEAEYLPTLTGQELALLLFSLKNHWDARARTRFVRIQEAFRSLTRIDFDVILNPEQEPSASSGGTEATGPPHFKHYPYIVFEEEGYAFIADFAAAGYFEVLLVLAATIGPGNSVVLLDEPVLNLHPAKQRELYEFLAEGAEGQGNQLLIVTHSSTFVAPNDLANAIRFSRTPDGSLARRLRFANTWEEAQAHKDMERTPHLLDALFARSVVLLEGPSEAAALPIWFMKCSEQGKAPASRTQFIDVGGDTHFGAIARILDAWGVPYRMIGDRKATDRLTQFGDRALVYPFDDLSGLLLEAYPEEFRQTISEVGGSGSGKDPTVARTMAFRLAAPPAIRDLWEKLAPFVSSS